MGGNGARWSGQLESGITGSSVGAHCPGGAAREGVMGSWLWSWGLRAVFLETAAFYIADVLPHAAFGVSYKCITFLSLPPYIRFLCRPLCSFSNGKHSL